jgi:hypothetical protein
VIPAHDAEAFAYVSGRIPTTFAVEGTVAHDPATTRAQYYTAMANAPTLAVALGQMGRALVAEQAKPGRFSAADHEMIDLVLPLDSGFYALLDQHLSSAVAAGVRIDAIKALRDGHDDLLTRDEFQQVEFIRAVRDGAMSDDIWARMVARLGSVRGTVEYCGFVLLLQFHHKFASALGTDVITRPAFDALLADLERAAAVPVEERG